MLCGCEVLGGCGAEGMVLAVWYCEVCCFLLAFQLSLLCVTCAAPSARDAEKGGPSLRHCAGSNSRQTWDCGTGAVCVCVCVCVCVVCVHGSVMCTQSFGA